MDIYSRIEQIETQKDFSDFLFCLKENVEQEKEDWENDDLASFLDGLYGYALDAKSTPDWKAFAEMLSSQGI